MRDNDRMRSKMAIDKQIQISNTYQFTINKLVITVYDDEDVEIWETDVCTHQVFA